jgi:hypothetical protein
MSGSTTLNQGLGFGGSIGGIAEAGMLGGLGFAGNVAIGVFTGPVYGNWQYNNGDVFATGGAWSNPPEFVLGAYGGLAVSGFVTNASSPTDMLGAFQNFNVSLGAGLGSFGVTISWGSNSAGNTIVVVSVGGGLPGWGASVSMYETTTTSLGEVAGLYAPSR